MDEAVVAGAEIWTKPLNVVWGDDSELLWNESILFSFESTEILLLEPLGKVTVSGV